VNVKFEVGESQSHAVEVQYSRLRNSLCLRVDGNVVRNDRFWVRIPLHRQYELQIGNDETQRVEVELIFPRMGRKFANPRCTVTVDGVAVAPVEQ
jgi:hypothetical protein